MNTDITQEQLNTAEQGLLAINEIFSHIYNKQSDTANTLEGHAVNINNLWVADQDRKKNIACTNKHIDEQLEKISRLEKELTDLSEDTVTRDEINPEDILSEDNIKELIHEYLENSDTIVDQESVQQQIECSPQYCGINAEIDSIKAELKAIKDKLNPPQPLPNSQPYILIRKTIDHEANDRTTFIIIKTSHTRKELEDLYGQMVSDDYNTALIFGLKPRAEDSTLTIINRNGEALLTHDYEIHYPNDDRCCLSTIDPKI